MPKYTGYADLGDFDVVTDRPSNETMNGSRALQAALAPPPAKHEVAYRRLKELIIEGELRGERDFLLQPLAQRLEISRNTLTRALNRLATEELVRHTPQKGYALLIPTAQQIELWYNECYEQVRAAMVLDNGEKRPRQYGLGREEKLSLAELLPDLAPPNAVAAELEALLRTAVSRSADVSRHAAFEATLCKLTCVRRLEHLAIEDHREDVAQLMRSFYRGQYDRFLRMLGVYTTKRVRASSSLASAIQLWAWRTDVA